MSKVAAFMTRLGEQNTPRNSLQWHRKYESYEKMKYPEAYNQSELLIKPLVLATIVTKKVDTDSGWKETCLLLNNTQAKKAKNKNFTGF